MEAIKRECDFKFLLYCLHLILFVIRVEEKLNTLGARGEHEMQHGSNRAVGITGYSWAPPK